MITNELTFLGLFFALALANTELPKFSKQTIFAGSNSVTVPKSNRLYTVSKNETHLQIKSSDKNFSKWSKKCTIAIDPEKDHIVGKIQETSSTNTIAIWGVKSSEVINATRITYYTLIIVKPLTCTYDSLTLPVHEMPADYPQELPTIQSYGFGFNIFYHNEKCSPCFVDKGGYQFTPSHQLAIDNSKPTKIFFLRRTRLLDGEIGYFYAYNFDNGTAVAKLLTRDYELVQKKIVNHSIEIADSDYSFINDETYSSFCYGNGTQQVICGQFDDDLELRFRQSVPLLPHYFVSSLAIKVDDKGRSFVGLIQSPLDQGNGTRKIFTYIFDLNGEVIKSIELGEIEQEYHYNELYNWILFHKGMQYCVHVVQMKKFDDTNTNEIVKCFDPFESSDLSSEFW